MGTVINLVWYLRLILKYISYISPGITQAFHMHHYNSVPSIAIHICPADFEIHQEHRIIVSADSLLIVFPSRQSAQTHRNIHIWTVSKLHLISTKRMEYTTTMESLCLVIAISVHLLSTFLALCYCIGFIIKRTLDRKVLSVFYKISFTVIAYFYLHFDIYHFQHWNTEQSKCCFRFIDRNLKR